MKSIIALTAVIFITGCDGVPAETAKPAGPPLAVTAATLSKAFQENEAKAKQDYDGKSLEVSGVVKDISLDFADAPVIKLKGSGDQYGMGVNSEGKMTDVDITGLSNEDSAKIKKGTKLTFTCSSIGEIMGSANLAGCSVKPG